MGTHPIFESDFDCLTDYKSALNKMPSPQEQKSSKMQEKPSLTLNNSSHRLWSRSKTTPLPTSRHHRRNSTSRTPANSTLDLVARLLPSLFHSHNSSHGKRFNRRLSVNWKRNSLVNTSSFWPREESCQNQPVRPKTKSKRDHSAEL